LHLSPHLQGFISTASLQKAAALRQQGAAFVIVSGARTSTVLQRLPYLPAADAIIAENGERNARAGDGV
jgi:hydroxymethylpyrimidine pyrophosphatase-like HAD family hydrolase